MTNDEKNAIAFCVGILKGIAAQKKVKQLLMLNRGIKVIKDLLEADCKSGVGNNDNYIQFEDGTWIDLDPSMQLNPAFNAKEGEKVKVLVIKED